MQMYQRSPRTQQKMHYDRVLLHTVQYSVPPPTMDHQPRSCSMCSSSVGRARTHCTVQNVFRTQCPVHSARGGAGLGPSAGGPCRPENVPREAQHGIEAVHLTPPGPRCQC